MSAPGTYLPTIHAYGKDRFINEADVRMLTPYIHQNAIHFLEHLGV